MSFKRTDEEDVENQLISFLNRVRAGDYARVPENNLLYVRMNEMEGYSQFFDDEYTYNIH
jgi:hypothetical protein